MDSRIRELRRVNDHVSEQETASWPARREKPPLDIFYSFTPFFEPGTILCYVVGEGFEFTCRTALFIGMLFTLTFYHLAFLSPEFLRLEVKGKYMAGTKVSAGNFIFAIVLLFAYLLCHDSAGDAHDVMDGSIGVILRLFQPFTPD